jgi:chromosome segregation ATPase
MGSNRPHTTYYNQDIIERGKVKFVVPVDLRSASTAIREKRRVNAAATLKYRAKQRKEEELAIQIQCLEQQLREAREEAERYRAEMNYFKDLVQPLTTERHDRPPSPRHAWKANSEGDR